VENLIAGITDAASSGVDDEDIVNVVSNEHELEGCGSITLCLSDEGIYWLHEINSWLGAREKGEAHDYG
jgi:hypothetical protein